MFDIPAEVKDLFEQDSVLKNYRIHFPNGECRDLNSSDMETESVEFTESICSMDTFMLGLNERSVFSFDAHNIPNIKNAEIEVTLQIDVYDLVLKGVLNQNQYTKDFIRATIPEMYELFGIEYFYYYEIPIGKFVVEECQKQSDMTIRRVTAYTRELKLEKGHCNPLELAKYDVTNYRRIGTSSGTSKYRLNITNFALANMYTDFYDEDTGEVGSNVPPSSTSSKIVTWKAETSKIGNRYRELEIQLIGNTYEFGTENTDYLYRAEIPKITKNNLFLKSYLKTLYDSALEAGFGEYEFLQNGSIPYDKDTTSKYYIDNSKNKSMYHNLVTGDSFVNLLSGVIFKNSFSTVYLNDYIYLYPYFGFSNSEISTDVKNFGYLYRLGIVTDVRFIEREYDYDVSLIGKVISDRTINVQSDHSKCKIISSHNEPNQYIDGETNLYHYQNPFKNRYFDFERVKSPSGTYMPVFNQSDFSDYISSWLEINGFNTIIARTGGYRIQETASKTSIYPENNLFPEDNLFPSESDFRIDPSSYETIWFDDEDAKSFRYVYYVYQKETSTESQKGYAVYDIFTEEFYDVSGMETSDFVVNTDNYSVYDLSDNKFITEEKKWSTSLSYHPYELVALALKGFSYTPAQIESPGRPYLEVGDSLDVLMKDESAFNTVILRRTLKGIQSLRDSYESK